jgi:hypothetical protein
MQLMKRLGFRRADEMDVLIALSAIRLSWLVVMVALLVWSIYGVVRAHEFTTPLLVLMLGLFVYTSTDLYLRRKWTGGPGE